MKSGGCLCNKARYQVNEPVRNLCYCHCESCRRAAGSAYVAWGTVNTTAFEITSGELAIVKSSPGVERGFCGACGTTLTYWHADRSEEIDVTLASFDDPSDLAPAVHIWTSDKLPWVNVEDGLPQYPKFRTSKG